MGVLDPGQAFHTRAYIHNLRIDLGQRRSHVVRPQTASQHHRSNQPPPGFTGQRQVEWNPRAAGRMRHARLYQDRVSLILRTRYRIQIGRNGDANHPPNLQAVGPEPCRVSWRIGTMKLYPAKPTNLRYAENLCRRLISENS